MSGSSSSSSSSSGQNRTFFQAVQERLNRQRQVQEETERKARQEEERKQTAIREQRTLERRMDLAVSELLPMCVCLLSLVFAEDREKKKKQKQKKIICVFSEFPYNLVIVVFPIAITLSATSCASNPSFVIFRHLNVLSRGRIYHFLVPPLPLPPCVFCLPTNFNVPNLLSPLCDNKKQKNKKTKNTYLIQVTSTDIGSMCARLGTQS
jgi:hypothetical protein